MAFNTRTGKLRTVNSIRQIVEQIEANEGPLERHLAKGIIGKSHLLNQPRFNFITDIPCEYMHLVCLGLVKRVTELTFKVGDNKERVTKRKLSDPALFNFYISQIQVVREFSRRCRTLDFSVFKAQEFRNLLLFFFPIVIKCIDEEYSEEIKLWYNLVFMIRSCILPNSEFRDIPDRKIETACETFFRLYEKLYGKINCTYTVHVVCSHLLLVRGSQPLTFRSAFKFESFFSEMKNLYVPGTTSTIKQVIENCFMKRAVEYHVCEKTIFYSCEKKPLPGKPFNPGMENNSLIYTSNDNNHHNFYKIVEMDDNDKDKFVCVKQGKFKFSNPLTPNLNWSDVGVYKLGPTLNEEQIIIHRNDICGKILKVDNLLITCPNNVLQEK